MRILLYYVSCDLREMFIINVYSLSRSIWYLSFIFITYLSSQHHATHRRSRVVMETRARELTDFPHLFGCYWGAWKSDSIHTQPEIIANRNAFGRFLARGKVRKPRQAELLELSLTYAGNEQMYANALDHLEYYRDSLGRYIQVCSEHGALNGDLHDKLVSEGWVVIKPMYYIGASTYARYIDMTVIKTKRDIIRVQREIDSLNQDLSYYRGWESTPP